MITVITGDDRLKAQAEVERLLGKDYEVFEGENLTAEAVMNIFRGRTLFAEKRKVLIKDAEPELFEEMAKYVEGTTAEVVVWESVTPLLKCYKDFLKLPGVTEKKFKTAPKITAIDMINIYNMALRDGKRAVEMLEKVKGDEDPYMFFGLMVSQALKRPEKRVLTELSKLDMLMKTTSMDAWALTEATLLKLSSRS